MAELLTLTDVHSKRVEIFRDAGSVNVGMRSFIEWLRDNTDQLDGDAREYLHDLLETLFTGREQLIEAKKDAESEASDEFEADDDFSDTADDATEDREASAEDVLVDAFSTKLINCTRALDKSIREAFRSTPLSSGQELTLGFFRLIQNELFAVQLLSSHSFFTQTNAHLRTILEYLDRIQLFNEAPDQVERWMEDPEDPAFSAPVVRDRIEKDSFASIYGCLRDRGLAPFWEKSGPNKEAFQLRTMVIALFVANQAVARVVGLFAERLDRKRLEATLPELTLEFRHFMEAYFLPWAEVNKLDTSAFSTWLSEWMDAKAPIH